MADEAEEIREAGMLGRLFGRQDRPERDPKVAVLRQVQLFKRLSKRELRKLADIVFERSYTAGEFMFEAGQPGAAMFIVKSGSLSIFVVGPDGREVEVARLEAGSFVGELALLDDTPRSASAKAIADTEALAFFRSDLNKLLDTAPALSSKIFRALALLIGNRLKSMNAQLSELEQQARERVAAAEAASGEFHIGDRFERPQS